MRCTYIKVATHRLVLQKVYGITKFNKKALL